MYNSQRINDLLEERRLPKKALLDYLGKNWNGSLDLVVKGDIRVSKIERIADFFGVSIDTFFDRQSPNLGVMVGGAHNKVHHFSVGSKDSEIKNLKSLLEEKDKRIKTLEEMIELLRRQIPTD